MGVWHDSWQMHDTREGDEDLDTFSFGKVVSVGERQLVIREYDFAKAVMWRLSTRCRRRGNLEMPSGSGTSKREMIS
jgi:hypothetical protein